MSLADRRLFASAFWIGLLALCLLGLGRDLWTPDEPREAGMIREMVLHPGVIPTLAGQPFYEKPPLYYWVAAAFVRASGGPSAWATRLPSALAGFLTLVVVYAWGRRAAGRSAGTAAALLLALCVQFTASVHWVLLDPLLMLFLALASWAGYELAAGGSPRAFLPLLYCSFAAALWTKGLVGPLGFAAGLAVFWAWSWRDKPWRAYRPLWGAFLTGLAFASVGAAFFLAGGREALWQWGYVNHVQRFLHPQTTGHAQPLWYYLPALALALFPWLVPAGAALRPAVWRDPVRRRLVRYCAGLVAGGLLLLSLSSTKRETYLLPLLPPLFVLLGTAWADLQERAAALRWAGGCSILQAVLSGLWGIVPPVAATIYTGRGTPLAAVLAVFSAVATLLALRGFGRGRFGLSDNPAQAAPAAAAVLGLFLLVVPALAPEKDLSPFVKELDRTLPAGRSVAVLGADETLRGIIPFVTGRPVRVLSARDLASDAPPDWLLWHGREESLLQKLRALGYRQRLARNFGPERTLSLWHRTPPGTPEREPSR